MTDKPRTIIYEDGEVLVDTADPTTYVTLDDEGLPATFLDLDAQQARNLSSLRERLSEVVELLDRL